jgi:hypothetical protein
MRAVAQPVDGGKKATSWSWIWLVFVALAVGRGLTSLGPSSSNRPRDFVPPQQPNFQFDLKQLKELDDNGKVRIRLDDKTKQNPEAVERLFGKDIADRLLQPKGQPDAPKNPPGPP